MKQLRFLLLSLLVAVLGVTGAKAQVGYQIALLNTATGEPRANETVTVSVKLSNNAGTVFYSETKKATTNDFGILSLSIGNADTFKDVDLSKMPFFIEVSANGVLIGKSQMLSVPVAEVAKQLAPMIDKSLIVGAWRYFHSDRDSEGNERVLHFNSDGTGSYDYARWYDDYKESRTFSFSYVIEGNCIYLLFSDTNYALTVLRYFNGELLGTYPFEYHFKK